MIGYEKYSKGEMRTALDEFDKFCKKACVEKSTFWYENQIIKSFHTKDKESHISITDSDGFATKKPTQEICCNVLLPNQDKIYFSHEFFTDGRDNTCAAKGHERITVGKCGLCNRGDHIVFDVEKNKIEKFDYISSKGTKDATDEDIEFFTNAIRQATKLAQEISGTHTYNIL